MIAIRSGIFNITFILWTFLLGTVGMPFSLCSHQCALTVARTWTYGTLFFLRIFCGITYEVRGYEHLPEGPVLIASKHQSAWDTTIFWALMKRPVFVLKQELIYIPVFGWQLLLLKSIYIDRKGGASAMKAMLRKAKQRANDNSSIIIFPEGTRTVPGGNAVYHPGVAALYQHLELPTIPVALNSGLYWGKKAFLKKPGKIIIEFLPAISPGLKSRDFMLQLHECIESASNILLG